MNAQLAKNIALKATDLPIAKEDIVYAIFSDFISLHKTPVRFSIYPQLSLKWKPDDPNDRRTEVPDFGIGNYTEFGANPAFKLRFGVEAKRAVEAMQGLPNPNTLKTNEEVRRAFHLLQFQAENQAKAALKGGYSYFENKTITWILLIGPYWFPITFGPFGEAALTVRSHKPSESEDWEESVKLEVRRSSAPRKLNELYLLCERTSYDRLEQILDQTKELAESQYQTFMQQL